MRKACAGWVAVAIVAVFGCSKGSPGGVGPDANKEAGPGPETFRLIVPTLATAVKQGGSAAVTIGITRGAKFDKDVALTFQNLPKGLTIDPPGTSIKRADADVTITVNTADDAPAGDYTFKVIGHPPEGDTAQNEIKITIARK